MRWAWESLEVGSALELDLDLEFAIVLERPLDPEQRREAIGQAAIGQREAQVEGDQHPRRDVALMPKLPAALQYDSLTNWMSSSVTLPATPVRDGRGR